MPTSIDRHVLKYVYTTIAVIWTLPPVARQLYGRGTTDDKGPALAWLFCIEAYQALGLELPVNLLFLIECMEESGSLGLDEVVQAEFGAGGYLEDSAAICVADNYWLGTKRPCVQYGLRGIVFFFVEVRGPARDLQLLTDLSPP